MTTAREYALVAVVGAAGLLLLQPGFIGALGEHAAGGGLFTLSIAEGTRMVRGHSRGERA